MKANRPRANEADHLGSDLEAVVFDMDGVLVDSEDEWARIADEYLRSQGARMSDQDRQEFYGCSEEHENVVLGRILGRDPAVVGREKNAFYKAHPLSYAPIVIPGARELIVHLKERGLKVALASSSNEGDVRRMMGECDLDGLLDAMVSGDMVRSSKPDPAIYLLAMEHLGIEPARAIAVEDSLYGLESARTAGLQVIQLNRGGQASFGPEAIAECSSHAEVGDVIDALLDGVGVCASALASLENR